LYVFQRFYIVLKRKEQKGKGGKKVKERRKGEEGGGGGRKAERRINEKVIGLSCQIEQAILKKEIYFWVLRSGVPSSE